MSHFICFASVILSYFHPPSHSLVASSHTSSLLALLQIQSLLEFLVHVFVASLKRRGWTFALVKLNHNFFFPEMKFKRKLNHIRQKKQPRNGSMLSVPCFSSERRRNRIILTLMRFFVSWFHECHLILAPHDVNMSCSDGRHRIEFLGSKECM